MSDFQLNPRKLNHWLNARKLTPRHVAERSHLTETSIAGWLTASDVTVSTAQVRELARVLNVDAGQLEASPGQLPRLIFQSRTERAATRRSIHRDGIHFYNYYSLPVPDGFIGPVILDILCPSGRIPKLNNGHLEPALTVNLGPGAINGRWAEELSPSTWREMAANRSSRDRWIVGDSYIEPSYSPHSYGLASDLPAQIISYTIASRLEPWLRKQQDLNEDCWRRAQEVYSHPIPSALLLSHMRVRGYTREVLSRVASLPAARLDAFLGGEVTALGEDCLRRAANALGVDYRLFAVPGSRRDEVGKTWCSIEDSRATVRPFGDYLVASLAITPELSDLSGLFMRVKRPRCPEPDLLDHCHTHYFVTDGELRICWVDGHSARDRPLCSGDAVWLSGWVPHGLWGDGSLVKLNSGEGGDYLSQIELSNCWNPAQTLERGWADRAGWGYDDERS